jgi:hypothetical protein
MVSTTEDGQQVCVEKTYTDESRQVVPVTSFPETTCWGRASVAEAKSARAMVGKCMVVAAAAAAVRIAKGCHGGLKE